MTIGYAFGQKVMTIGYATPSVTHAIIELPDPYKVLNKVKRKGKETFFVFLREKTRPTISSAKSVKHCKSFLRKQPFFKKEQKVEDC